MQKIHFYSSKVRLETRAHYLLQHTIKPYQADLNMIHLAQLYRIRINSILFYKRFKYDLIRS